MEPTLGTSQGTITPATYTAYAVGLVVVGVALGFLIDPYFPSPLSNTKKAFQSGLAQGRLAGIQEIKAKVEKSVFLPSVTTQKGTRSFTGTVTNKTATSFTVHASVPNLFDDPSLADKTILITKSTPISKVTIKEVAVVGQKKATTPQQQNTAVTASASFSDLVVGDNVNVFSLSDISTSTQFFAQSVLIMPRAK